MIRCVRIGKCLLDYIETGGRCVCYIERLVRVVVFGVGFQNTLFVYVVTCEERLME